MAAVSREVLLVTYRVICQSVEHKKRLANNGAMEDVWYARFALSEKIEAKWSIFHETTFVTKDGEKRYEPGRVYEVEFREVAT